MSRYLFWLGASADAETGSGASMAPCSTVATLTGFDPARRHGRALARCRGGRFCRHNPGECTADPEYQRFIARQRPGAEL